MRKAEEESRLDLNLFALKFSPDETKKLRILKYKSYWFLGVCK